MTLKEKARKIKRDIPAIFLALREKETPIGAKILAGITVGYALSPIDLVPDFIPVLGYLDDVILLPLLIAWTVSLIPDEVMNRCREKADGMWQNGKPKKWYYALPIVLIWILVVYLIVRAVLL